MIFIYFLIQAHQDFHFEEWASWAGKRKSAEWKSRDPSLDHQISRTQCGLQQKQLL